MLPMHLAQLRLRDFRNYVRLDVAFEPGFHLLLGNNAQGKTNILEAIYLVATLRSFRGVGGSQLIRFGQPGYFVGSTVIAQGTHETKMYWSAKERTLSLNGRPIRRLQDYFGTLRTVIFCTEDLQLIKGSGRFRRRFLDLLLAQSSPGYLGLLQRYMEALRSRNALLKNPSSDAASLEGFSLELIASGREIIRQREELIPKIALIAKVAARRIASEQDDLEIRYQPSVKADFEEELARSQARERMMRATLVGPHRDELELLLNGRSAAQFGSEGQKRTVAIALKVTQAEYLTTIHGTPPVLLIDDIMGELDIKRRSGLMPLLERAHHGSGQVFMTATETNWPEELGRKARHWTIQNGGLQ